MGDLIVPLAYWNWTPSNHNITAVVVSPDKNFLVTGATNGKLFMWDVRYSHKQNIDSENEETRPRRESDAKPDIKRELAKSVGDMKKLQDSPHNLSRSHDLRMKDKHVDSPDSKRKIGHHLDNLISSIEHKIHKHHDDKPEKFDMRKSNNNLKVPETPEQAKAASHGHKRQMSRDNMIVTNSIHIGQKEEKGPQRPRISLRCVMMGHTTTISALVSIVYNSIEAFVSVSNDGTLCIWSFYDGRCLACAEKLLKCSPTMLTILPSGYHVAVAGNHTDIEIVNLKKLKISKIMSAHQTWVTSLFAAELRSGEPVLISGSADVIQFWSLKKNETDHPIQSLCLDITEPLSIALAPNARSVLIVTAKRWLLVTARDHKEVANVLCPDSEWSGGSFVSNRAVMIWSKEGNAFLYPIPRLEKSIPLSFVNMKDKASVDEIPVPNPAENEDDEVVVESPKQQPTNWRNQLLSRLNITDKTSTRLQPACIFCTEEEGEEQLSPRSLSSTMGIFGRVLVSGSKEGKVKIWIVPSRLEKSISERK